MEQACTSSRKATLKVGGVLLASRSALHGDAWSSTLKHALTPINMCASQRQADNHAKMSQSKHNYFTFSATKCVFGGHLVSLRSRQTLAGRTSRL